MCELANSAQMTLLEKMSETSPDWKKPGLGQASRPLYMHASLNTNIHFATSNRTISSKMIIWLSFNGWKIMIIL